MAEVGKRTVRLVQSGRRSALKTRVVGAPKDAVSLIEQNIKNSQFKWRTPRGIAKDAGLSEKQVVKILEESSQFIRARQPSASGQSLYSLRGRYKAESPFISRLISAITNQPEA